MPSFVLLSTIILAYDHFFHINFTQNTITITIPIAIVRPVNSFMSDSIFPVVIILKPVYVINTISPTRIQFDGMLNDTINLAKAIAAILSNIIDSSGCLITLFFNFLILKINQFPIA